MESNAFASLARVQLPSQSRLLASACCPDKDLVVLISRLGGQDRLSLWKMQGARKWEVDVGTQQSTSEEIVGLAWSPDGQTIAVAHDPPRISLHSIQDGQEERTLPVVMPLSASRRSSRIIGIWWFQQERKITQSAIPDIFKRNETIVRAYNWQGGGELFDLMREFADSATDLFAFQGSQTRSTPKSSQPEVFKSWPALLPDYLAASISSPLQDGNLNEASDSTKDGLGDANMNSILAIADDLGHIHCFLDGSFPLGAMQILPDASVTSVFKDPKLPVFLAHLQRSAENSGRTDLQPVTIDVPLLKTRKPRDLANLSSTARELVWYVARVVKEMRAMWFGSDTFSGARELGPKWIRALESKQKDQFGHEEPNGMLDLTSLLVTGRVSEALADFLGSGEQMSERGIQKWESTVTDALTKMRDFSEKRVAPACQRLLLVLQEALGWSQLPQYSLFELEEEDIKVCLDLAGRAIVISGWLAAVARRELARFKEFISFIRYETVAVNPATETRPVPEHDMLEVNHYLMSGLVVSSIDKWFMGPIPQFSPEDLGVLGDKQDLQSALNKAHTVASDPTQMAWQANIKQKDLSHLDRNLDALIQELATRCQRVFIRAAGATARSALVKHIRGPEPAQVADARPHSHSNGLIVRDRITENKPDAGVLVQYLAIHVPTGDRAFLCLARMHYGAEVQDVSSVVDAILLECRLPEGNTDEPDFQVLGLEFFDDETMIILYKARGTEDGSAPAYIATFSYNDLGYQSLHLEGYVTGPSREDMVQRLLTLKDEGQITSFGIPIKCCRELIDGTEGDVSLAVNGRIGRRIACVLDNKGSTMEVLDMEGSAEEMELEENAETDADDSAAG